MDNHNKLLESYKKCTNDAERQAFMNVQKARIHSLTKEESLAEIKFISKRVDEIESMTTLVLQ